MKKIEKEIKAVENKAAQVKTDLIHEVVTMLSDVDGNKVSVDEYDEDQIMVSYDGGGDLQRSTLYADVLDVSLDNDHVNVHISNIGASTNVWLDDMPFQDVVTIYYAVKANI